MIPNINLQATKCCRQAVQLRQRAFTAAEHSQRAFSMSCETALGARIALTCRALKAPTRPVYGWRLHAPSGARPKLQTLWNLTDSGHRLRLLQHCLPSGILYACQQKCSLAEGRQADLPSPFPCRVAACKWYSISEQTARLMACVQEAIQTTHCPSVVQIISLEYHVLMCSWW